MNQDNNLINIYNNQSVSIAYDTNRLDGYITVKTARTYEPVVAYYDGTYDQIDYHVRDYVDKDEKIRNLEARVKELEAILEEEI